MIPGAANADIYKLSNNSSRHHMRWQDRIYSFTSLQDCELIISQLQARTAQYAYKEEVAGKTSLQTDAATVAARLSRYMSSDMHWMCSEVLKVSQSGSLTGLSAIV